MKKILFSSIVLLGIIYTVNAQDETVNGNLTLNGGTTGTSKKIIFKTSDNNDLSKYIGTESYWTVIGANGNEGWKFKDNTGDILMQINGKGNNNGYIGIGTSNPDMKLTVKGSIHAEEVKIDLNIPAPDYVFKKGYNLRSIEEVEKFIEKNSHLPEIPSAKEFEQNGIIQGEMDMNLLKKIEELTLYTIAQEKKIKKQSEKIENLELLNKKLLELQSRLEKLESEK